MHHTDSYTVVMSRWTMPGNLLQQKTAVLGVMLVAALVFVLGGYVQDMRSLLASTTSAVGFDKDSILFFRVQEDEIRPEDTITVDVRVNAGLPINVVGATILYDPDFFSIVGVNKETSLLTLWTEEIIDHQSGTMRLSGGTVSPKGHVGPGTIITLILRAKKSGTTKLSFGDSQIYAHDGRGTLVSTEKKPTELTVATPTEGASPSGSAATPIRNSDFNNDGVVTLADVSIFAVQLFTRYDSRYDLNRDGHMDIADLSIVFTAMNVD